MTMSQSCENGAARGTVLRIERASIHDGEGLRTVAFLKGCPLSCAWCSTPESQEPEIRQAAGKTYGNILSVDEVAAEIEKDQIFFFHSGGGMTLSGGEPLFQADFSAALLKECKIRGVNTAMESSLCAPFEALDQILPSLDTLYADLKLIDRQKHREYCGLDNALILDNLRRAAESRRTARLIVRIPLIPRINDSDEDLTAAAAFCRDLGTAVSAVELLPYHRLGVPTYERLGRPYRLPEIRPPQDDYLKERKKYFFDRML